MKEATQHEQAARLQTGNEWGNKQRVTENTPPLQAPIHAGYAQTLQTLSLNIRGSAPRKPTGRELVRMALERGESLTALDALRRFGLHSLAGAIHALRCKGVQIEAEMIETPSGARVALYRLAKVGTP